VGRSHQPRVWR